MHLQPTTEADIPTPYLRLDYQRIERNVERLAAYAKEHGLGLRPHTKTHKSQRLARLQLDHGAVGLTVAKAGEARVMADVAQPPADLLLGYPAVDRHRAAVVAELAGQHTMRVAVDSVQAAETLAHAAKESGNAIGILIDMDVGMGRTGVPTPEAAQQLAQQIDRIPGLRLDGLFCYPGHIRQPPARQPSVLEPIAQQLADSVERFDRHGLCRAIVSGGSTPTAYQSHHLPQLTEIRPGTYIFNDMNTVRGEHAALEDCAAAILATVISSAVTGQVIVDAGSKALTSDPSVTDGAGHGYVMGYPEACVVKLSEEHGQIDVSACTAPPRIGQRLTIIPNHICPCVNLQDMAWLDDGSDNLQPLPIDARGKLC